MKKKITYFKFAKLSGFGVAFFVAVPAVIIAISLLITNYMNVRSNKELLQKSYATALEWVAKRGEEDISNVLSSLKSLGNDDRIISAMTNDAVLEDEWEAKKVSERLREFSAAHPIVRDMVVLDNNSRYVISEAGLSNFSDYFINESSYEDYPAGYWRNIRYYVLNGYKTLSPTVRTTRYGEENIIPMVISKIDEYNTRKILLVNLRTDAVIKESYAQFFTPNSRLYFINRRTGKIFGVEGEGRFESMSEPEFYQRLITREEFFDYKLNGKKCFIVSSAIGNDLVGYTYFATIPYVDINRAQRGMVFSIVLVCLFFIAAAGATMFGSINGIMNPIRRLAVKLGVLEDKSLIEKISSACEKMLSDREKMMNVLPVAQEKYLMSCLNMSEYSISEKARDIIKATMPFEKKYFASIAVKMCPTDAFYERYDGKDYYNITDSFYTLVKEEFCESFDAFLLHPEENMVYIVLNFDDSDMEKEIYVILKRIEEYLKNDTEIIEFFVGVSGVYDSADKLKKACDEATLEMTAVIRKQSFDFRKKTNRSADLDEGKLFQALVAGKTDEGAELIKNALEEVKDGDIRAKKQKCLQALNAVLRVYTVKNISTEGKMDYEIYSDAANKSTEEIYRMVLSMISAINANSTGRRAKIDSDLIMEYIDENYADPELSLKKLADIFCAKENYLSSLIKNKVGIGFKEYVLNLRIDNAKRLLVESDMNIQEIYEKTGYVSKQSFFRSFKSAVGITPGEYRKNYK